MFMHVFAGLVGWAASGFGLALLFLQAEQGCIMAAVKRLIIVGR